MLVPLVIFDTFCFVCKRKRVCVTHFIVSYMTRKELFTREFQGHKLHLYYVHKILCSSLLDCVWFTFDLFSLAFYVDKLCLVLQLDCKCYKLH